MQTRGTSPAADFTPHETSLITSQSAFLLQVLLHSRQFCHSVYLENRSESKQGEHEQSAAGRQDHHGAPNLQRCPARSVIQPSRIRGRQFRASSHPPPARPPYHFRLHCPSHASAAERPRRWGSAGPAEWTRDHHRARLRRVYEG